MNTLQTAQHIFRSLSRPKWSTLALDAFLLAGLAVFVMFSHVIPIPLYKMDPMKIFLMVAIVFSSRGNALLMAASLPLISTLSVGHPIFPKNLIISAEMVIFVGMISAPFLSRYGKLAQFFSAVLVSKIAYYGLKALLISAGALEMSLFSTPLAVQGMSVLVLLGVFYLLSLGKSEQLL